MIFDFHDGLLVCPKCGHIRVRVETSYEAAPQYSNKFGEQIHLRNRHIRLVCALCGETIKELDELSDECKLIYE